MTDRTPTEDGRAAVTPAVRHRTGPSGGTDGGLSPWRLLLFLGGGVFVLDVVTKWLVTNSMVLHQSIPVLGDVVRLTYIRNPGAAFGLHLGDYSRPFFIVVTFLALVFLGWMYAQTPSWDRIRLVSLVLLMSGAAGNLLDRLRWEAGVIDFVDVGLGDLRWPVFNVADSAITIGAVLLAVSLWRHEAANDEDGRREAGETKGEGGSGGDG